MVTRCRFTPLHRDKGDIGFSKKINLYYGSKKFDYFLLGLEAQTYRYWKCLLASLR